MWKTPLRSGLLLPLILVAGCTPIATLAPPVNEKMVSAAYVLGYDRSDLERGRLLYLSDCARCHSPVTINSLSKEQWSTVLPRMVGITNLDQEAQQSLESYITCVLRE